MASLVIKSMAYMPPGSASQLNADGRSSVTMNGTAAPVAKVVKSQYEME